MRSKEEIIALKKRLEESGMKDERTLLVIRTLEWVLHDRQMIGVPT